MATLADGDRYFAGTLRNSQWQAHREESRETAIHEAAMMIGGLTFSRRPPQLDNAIYEQAFCLLEQQTSDTSASQKIAMGIKSWSLDDAAESYSTQAEVMTGPGWIDGVYFCPRALAWVKDYLQADTVKTGRLVRRHGG